MSDKKININVPVLARVEGEGALELSIEKEQITKLILNIFEPPRFFEKFLEGRHYSEVPDIVARICGICPVAYQMSAVHAMENLFDVEVTPWVKQMRRLFYCGEWIESHALHIHLLAAPDFLGYNSAPEMAKDFPNEVRRGVQLQHLGNRIVKLLGGRSVHPVGVRVGGFHAAPDQSEIDSLLVDLRKALVDAENLLEWVASLNIPAIEQTFLNITLKDTQGVAFISDVIAVGKEKEIAINDFDAHFKEHHIPHSTALHSLYEGQPYLVGPLARLNNHFVQLPEEIQAKCRSLGLSFPSSNMYHSILARAIEIWYALLESVRILSSYELPDSPYAQVNVKPGVAIGASEAPRGVLWHRYEVGENGLITSARIVPPTSQNQARIEEDLKNTLESLGLNQSAEALRLQAEQVIRNYDPCISCATHFLDLRINRL